MQLYTPNKQFISESVEIDVNSSDLEKKWEKGCSQTSRKYGTLLMEFMLISIKGNVSQGNLA